MVVMTIKAHLSTANNNQTTNRLENLFDKIQKLEITVLFTCFEAQFKEYDKIYVWIFTLKSL